MKGYVYYNAKLDEIRVFNWFWHGFLSLTIEGTPDHVILLGEL